MLKAGVAIRDITPDCQLEMAGYPGGRSAKIAHDPLYASAFYFENEKERVLILASDLICMSIDRAAELRMLIEKHTGIPRNNVMVGCSHTHSGPVTLGLEWQAVASRKEMYPQNNDKIRDRMLEAAKEAVETAFDAVVGWGSGRCGKEQGVGGNRHDAENGPCDPSVNVLAIRDLSGVLRGCVVNYSLHPTVLHADNLFYTADYPCYIRQTVNSKNPHMVFGFMVGATGDQSSRFFRRGQSFDEAKRIGGAIGQTAVEVLETLSYTGNVELASAAMPAVPPVKQFPSHEEALQKLDAAKKVYEELAEAQAPYSKVRAAQSLMEGALCVVNQTRSLQNMTLEELLEPNLPIECHAVRVGDCCFLGVGGECFVGLSDQIKAASPYALTILSCQTNGCTKGYLCTDEAFERQCYEAQATCFARGTERTVVEAAVQAIRMTGERRNAT